MHESIESFFTILLDMWRRRWIGIAVAWAVALAAAFLVLRVPERYEATARVYVDTQTMLKPLMQGLTVEPDVDEMVSMLARNLITRPKIEELITKIHFDEENTPTEQSHEALIQSLTRNIKFASSGGRNVYEVTYRDADPNRALRVVQELVSLFVSSGKGNKIRDTEDTRRFIDEQISIYESKLQSAENRLKEFKLKNVGVLGGSNQDFFARMAAAQQDLAQARVELRSAEESRDALQRELAGIKESGQVVPAGGGSATPELDARIEAQRKQLDEMRRRYTDDHPDVIAAKRLIAQLVEERQHAIDERSTVATPNEVQSNPVYQQIKVKFADASATVASLRGRTAELASRLDELRGSAKRVPEVEAEMAQLNRDYDVIKRNYEGLVARREAASISSDVDASAQLAEFRVVEPPRVGSRPVFPNHLTMVAAALFVSLAAGVFASYGLTQLNPTIHDLRGLRQACSRPPLGSVSLVASTGLSQSVQRGNLLFASTLGLLIAIYSAWAAKILLTTSAQ